MDRILLLIAVTGVIREGPQEVVGVCGGWVTTEGSR